MKLQNSQPENSSEKQVSKFINDTTSYPKNIKSKKQAIFDMAHKLQRHTSRNFNTTNINSQIYHILLCPFTLDNAYSNLSRNKGAFTEGVITGNIQGYSRNTTTKIIQQLKDETYTPQPVRRIWIPKPGKKEKRPLGVPTFIDKVVQEAVRGILEAIYEPEFQEFAQKVKRVDNFGFRPNLGCWDAIEHFTKYGQKISYVIEGDIKGAYDNVNFNILLKILSKRIKDKKFLKLIKKMLLAGIMDEGRYEHSLIGVPQGGVLSPLLFNIYMFEFDKFIQNEIIEPNNQNQTKKIRNKSKEYQRNLYAKKIAAERLKKYSIDPLKQKLPRIEYRKERKILLKEVKQKQSILLRTKSYDKPTENSFVYTRYADDWILGIGGNLEFTQQIQSQIDMWLRENLKFTLSPNKTKITNIQKSFVPFLGYEILLRNEHRRTKIKTFARTNEMAIGSTRSLVTRRTTSMKFFVRPDKAKIYNKVKQLGLTTGPDLYPIGKRSWASLDEFQIVQKYHSIFLGLIQHYNKCNTSFPLNRISYIFLYSCAKTIAARQKITMPQVFEKYGKNLEIIREYKDSDKIRKVEFMGLTKIHREYPIKRSSLTPYFDPFKIRTFWRTTFKLYSQCCICGCSENIEMHHKKSLKSIKQSKTNKTSFNLILKQLNRKQIPVCRKCHNAITSGQYDGMKLTDLYDISLAKL